MAKGVNSVTVLGNLGQDPEVRYSQSGNAVCKLSVAVGERHKKGDEWVDHTEWIRVVCFGKTAENAGQYLSKGRQVYVTGRMSTSKYEKDGVTHYGTEVVAREVIFLGGDRDTKQDRPQQKDGRGAGKPPSAKDDDGFYDENLPF